MACEYRTLLEDAYGQLQNIVVLVGDRMLHAVDCL